MGLLTEGTPLSWQETKKVGDYIKEHGIQQFINLYNRLKERSKDCLFWGDEVEYMLVKLDSETKRPKLLLKAAPLLEKLNEAENNFDEDLKTIWRPEYGAYMVEGTPGKPYGPRMIHFNTVEANMKRRREEVMKLLSDDNEAFAMTLSSFPRMGCEDFTIPPYRPDPINGVSRSLFFPDEAIYPAHPRFKTLSRNIRERRGDKPSINIPIFRDTHTPNPFREDFSLHVACFYDKGGDDNDCGNGDDNDCGNGDDNDCDNRGNGNDGEGVKIKGYTKEKVSAKNKKTNTGSTSINKAATTKATPHSTTKATAPITTTKSTTPTTTTKSTTPTTTTKATAAATAATAAAEANHIYMDCMGFGMGCCCLQVTFQACNICEARQLYDQLTFLCPIMLALSASSPIYKGYLSDHDCRWDIISASVDDRTKEERGLEPFKENKYIIPKSRYAPISCYLSPCSDPYNDLDPPFDLDIYNQLMDNGIDKYLAKHIAHLFIRDPISVFSEKIDLDDNEDTDHFENIQSTNWQTMRFKPPPPKSDIGWRVEFRPMEVQLTDFENAAYVVFVVLLTRVILTYKLNFVIPISKVDENMRTAQKRDACRQHKFWFKKDISTCYTPKEAESFCCGSRKDKGEGNGGVNGETSQHGGVNGERDENEMMNGVVNAERESKKSQKDEEYQLLTIHEIISGKPGCFPGLKPLIERYLKSVDDCDVDTSCTITQYLNLIEKRASGELLTMAQWTRQFVLKHPQYKHDSKVADSTAYDLLRECKDITFGLKEVPGFLNKHITRTTDNLPPLLSKMDALHRDMAAKHGRTPVMAKVANRNEFSETGCTATKQPFS